MRLAVGVVVVVASLVGSFSLHEYHAVRRVACADYMKGEDHIAFLHPCIASARTRWADFAAFTIVFLGLTVGGSLVIRQTWNEPTRGREPARRVAVR